MRDASIRELQAGTCWDLLVIGGGATGLGVAVDAASRGYHTLLLERGDFGEGTSSRSTKLIHGGVRYLEQGRVGLVRESLRERALLLKNAASLVRPIRFLVPAYTPWDRLRVRAGLRLYDALAGGWKDDARSGLGSGRPLGAEPNLVARAYVLPSRGVDADGARRIWPGLPRVGLRGGTTFADAQFDDARLAVALARAVHRLGSVALNYVEVVALTRGARGRVSGVVARDLDPGPDGATDLTDGSECGHIEVRAKVVVDATGIFSERTRQLGIPGAGADRDPRLGPGAPRLEPGSPRLALSRGSHVVLGPEFVCSDHALLIPRTDDGRVIFAIPWSGHLLVGTTDIPVAEPNREPRPTRQEVDYLLRYVGAYLDPPPCLSDVRSVWAGIRPLVAGKPGAATSRLSREHAIFEAIPGLVSVVGGKWTTYRSMAEAVVDRASISGSLPRRASGTRSLPIEDPGDSGVEVAGESFVRRAVREEMARTAEDLLARRSRILFLDARRARALAEPVAGLMAAELGRNEEWVEAQVRQMVRLSEDYLPFGFEDGGSDA